MVSRWLRIGKHGDISRTHVRIFHDDRDVTSIRCDGHESASGPTVQTILWEVVRNGDVPFAVLHVPQGSVREQPGTGWKTLVDRERDLRRRWRSCLDDDILRPLHQLASLGSTTDAKSVPFLKFGPATRARLDNFLRLRGRRGSDLFNPLRATSRAKELVWLERRAALRTEHVPSGARGGGAPVMPSSQKNRLRKRNDKESSIVIGPHSLHAKFLLCDWKKWRTECESKK